MIPRLRAPLTLAVDDLLAPLAHDLHEWRLASGRPGDDDPRKPTLEAGVPYQVPYDLRHSFA